MSGTYRIDRDKITFYSEVLSPNEELMDGTIDDGVLKITIVNITTEYRKVNGSINNGTNSTTTEVSSSNIESIIKIILRLTDGNLLLNVNNDTQQINLSNYITEDTMYSLLTISERVSISNDNINI